MLELRQSVWAASVGTVLLVASSSSSSTSSVARPSAAGPVLVADATTPAPPSAGRQWLTATRAVLDDAREVQVPFAEQRELGRGEAAAAFAFDALGGQRLEVRLDGVDGEALDGVRIYVDVFRVVEVLGQPLRERLAGWQPSAERLRTRLPSDGTYHLLVQTDGAGVGRYRVTVELAAALPFPVAGASEEAIRSLFGASRDDGRRHHQGIDIFVRPLTPVLAVAAGRVMPRQDALGGNTVWLNTPGTSYYYAHLDRTAVHDQQWVKPGDVLGYVGNSGNARNMPSHLHFGVYRWGKNPIDPLPLVVGQRFAGDGAATAAIDAGG